jgi:porphyrinogen peroxidase
MGGSPLYWWFNLITSNLGPEGVMTVSQTGICAEGEAFGLFLTLVVADGPAVWAVVRRVAAALAGMNAAAALRLEEPNLACAIAFGADAWDRLCGPQRPAELTPFEPLSDGGRVAPATPADLFLHIHSARHDANFALAREVMAALGDAVRVVEEIHGFKTLGGRDLTGFVDGTENPKGEERAEVALVGAEDPDFAGGSYVNIQRYVHNLPRWEGLPVADQEAAVGRTKADDVELDDDIKPPTAHIARVVIEEDGQELELVRHSLPYGTTSENGLYFVAYGRSPQPFRKMLQRMVVRDNDGSYDRLLDFTHPVTGSSFFAPSLAVLRQLGQMETSRRS